MRTAKFNTESSVLYCRLYFWIPYYSYNSHNFPIQKFPAMFLYWKHNVLSVRYEIHPKIKGNFNPQHLAMAYVVIRQPFAAECQVRYRAQTMWDLWLTKQHRHRYFSEYLVLSLSVSTHECSLFIFVSIYYFLLSTRRTSGRSLGTLKTQCCFVNHISLHAKLLTLYGIQRDENAWR